LFGCGRTAALSQAAHDPVPELSVLFGGDKDSLIYTLLA
jgi:hypothetical protein